MASGLRSFRFSLGSLIGLVVFVAGMFVLAFSAWFSIDAVTQLASQQFREVSRRQVVATQARLGTAAPALDTLDAALTDSLATATPEQLARAFLGVLRANPGFTWVSYGDEQGNFTGAYRQGGKFFINRSTIKDGKTELFEHEVAADGTWVEVRHERDTGYDPRTRPFYTLAKQEKRRVWTRPYVFYEQGVPGITCARPHVNAYGRLLGVLTIDFDLNALSDFVRSADLSEHGTVLLFTPDGTLLAHPEVKVVATQGGADKGTLVNIADLPGAPMKALHQEFDHQHEIVELDGGVKLQTFRVKVDGAGYLASFTAFPVDQDLTWFVGAIAPEADFLGTVWNRLLLAFVGLMGFLLIAVPAASSMIAGYFSRHVTALSDGMAETGRLELADKPLPKSGVREIVAMQQELAKMKGGLRSFARFVPRDLVRRVLSSGREAVLGGETRELTVFFSDIEGFTSIAETMSPEALVNLLGRYLEEMTAIIGAHGGTVDKFLGDGILAFWGAPEPDPAHAVNAAKASLACAKKLDELVAAGTFGGKTLRTRIGLATGPVLVGNIGTPERMNYTVMGDTANLSSRLEGLNKAYGTRNLVSEETAVRLGGQVFSRAVDVVAVKGKALGVQVFELLAVATGKPEHDADHRWLSETSATALAAYLARDFAKAASTWERILETRPGDTAAKVMKQRAELYLRVPPPSDWTGVTVAKEK